MANPRSDEHFMRAALNEAEKGIGHTSPNPAVGSVLVIGDRIVARGHHRGPGLPHAETECLARWKKSVPAGAVLYVTLEPCSTTGRTGPCTEAIIASGIKRVVIGTIDVNPRHQGRGVRLLEDAGITVRVGVLSAECARLNEYFNKWIVTGHPFVIAKCGMSLDGRLSRPPGEPQWLTSPASRRRARQLRAEVDAILIGAETVRRDNPRLTVRGAGDARQPLRVVLAGKRKLPADARLFRDQFKERTVVYKNESLGAVLADLGKQQVTSVLIEGGGKVFGQALDERLIDKVQIYLAPMFTGGDTIAFGGKGAATTINGARIEQIAFENSGPDVCITGYPR